MNATCPLPVTTWLSRLGLGRTLVLGMLLASALPVSLAGQSAAVPAAPVTAPVNDAESHAVYAALVSAPTRGSQANLPVLRLETVRPPDSCRALDAVSPVWRAAAQDFASANRAPRLLRGDQVSRRAFIPVPSADIDKAVASGWDRFRATYKGAGGYVSVSAVGFDPAGTRAIAWVTYACGPSCGSREFRFFVKKGRDWQEEPPPHGVTCP